MGRKLPLSFFARNTIWVAHDLLGSLLVRITSDGSRLSGRIVETEAYLPNDAASHAFRGKTARNASMFARPGTVYVYFTYGMHYCVNVVTEAMDTAAAVLIRAIEPVDGIASMQLNRRLTQTGGKDLRISDLCRGPARLCRAMKIDRTLDGEVFNRTSSVLRIEEGAAFPETQITNSTRIGISGNVEAQQALLRWFVKDNPSVSSLRKSTGLN